MNECGFKYVLLGHTPLDSIEGQFCRIGQLSRANYFISMRQLYESDRKLRTLSLLKYSQISLKEIEDAAKAREERTAILEVIFRAESLYADMPFNIMPTENDVSVTFCVTGYCCRSLAKSNRCDSCKDITIASVEYLASEAEPNVPVNAINFFNDINRCGLFKPTKKMFDVGMLCWGAFAELSVKKLKKRFLSSVDQRSVFKEIVNIAFFESGVVPPRSVPTMCSKSHNLLEGISARFFNWLKNLMRNMRAEESSRVSRKINKIAKKIKVLGLAF